MSVPMAAATLAGLTPTRPYAVGREGSRCQGTHTNPSPQMEKLSMEDKSVVPFPDTKAATHEVSLPTSFQRADGPLPSLVPKRSTTMLEWMQFKNKKMSS